MRRITYFINVGRPKTFLNGEYVAAAKHFFWIRMTGKIGLKLLHPGRC